MIRLSYTTLNLLNSCERKFQLDKLLDSYISERGSEHFAFGHAFETGCVSYILHGNVDRAIFDAYLAYHEIIEGCIEINETAKKNELVAANMVWAAIPNLNELKDEWEIAIFNEKQAVQLSFRIDINQDLYYVGYLDLALKNRYTGKYAVFDVKTTGLNLHTLDPLYMNSEQLIGYSVILDYIAGKDNTGYDVYYLVGQLGAGNGFTPKIHCLQFPKSLKDRLDFFISLGMDVARLSEMMNTGIFPRRGSACLKYNKPCYHFGTCGLHALDKPKVQEEDTTKYDFTMKLDELIKDHLNRINV